MPRALPWLKTGSANAATNKVKPAARHTRDAASEDDFVNSDLEPAHTTKPEKKKPERKRIRASSSSPPPPGPPPVESIKPGFAADDIYMMVEDEFYSTAQLYTSHIHHAEYVRLKKLHKSRGQELLAGLGRGTDGKTEQSKALRTKMESLELAKKQKQAVRTLRAEADSGSDAEGSEAEDEYMQDPHLAGLMRASQMAQVQDLTGLASPRASTRAAAGYSQSPFKAARTKDVFAEEKQPQRKSMPKVDRDDSTSDDRDSSTDSRLQHKANIVLVADEDSETDEDLDAGVPTHSEWAAVSGPTEKVVADASNSRGPAKEEIRKLSDARPLAKFSRPAETTKSIDVISKPSRPHTSQPDSRNDETPKLSRPSVKPEPNSSPRGILPVTLPIPAREKAISGIVARKRAERAAAEAKRMTIKKEDMDDIPTFLF
uniref:Uncharacterized protein n=1 Tax=Ramularia collo-cygni TaxID=112498 RepID=A0A2D3UTA7_9PEZI